MRILFIAPRFHTNMVEWIRTLQVNNHEIFMSTLLSHDTEDHSLIRPIKFKLSIFSKIINFIFGDGGQNLKRGFPEIIIFFKYFKKVNPEIIIIRDLSRWFSILALFFSKIINTKIVIYSQNKIYNKFNFRRKLLHNIVCILFNPAFISPIKGMESEGVNKLKNTYYVPFIAKKYNLKKNNKKYFRILSIGKFTKRKNLIELIETIKELTNEGINIKLDIVSEVFTPEHFENLNKAFVKYDFSVKDSSMKIYINIPHKNIKNFYDKADLFILPSTAEPASISVIEALANDIPVICSSTCGTSEYITPGKNGLIFRDKDFFEMKHQIKLIMKQDYNYKDSENLLNKDEYFYNFFSKMLKNQFDIHI